MEISFSYKIALSSISYKIYWKKDWLLFCQGLIYLFYNSRLWVYHWLNFYKEPYWLIRSKGCKQWKHAQWKQRLLWNKTFGSQRRRKNTERNLLINNTRKKHWNHRPDSNKNWAWNKIRLEVNAFLEILAKMSYLEQKKTDSPKTISLRRKLTVQNRFPEEENWQFKNDFLKKKADSPKTISSRSKTNKQVFFHIFIKRLHNSAPNSY